MRASLKANSGGGESTGGRTARSAFWELSDRLRVPAVAERFCSGKGWLILWAHGICDDRTVPMEHYPRDIAVSVFRGQMEHLIARGYQFVSMSEGVRRLAAGEPLDRVATITFDDGFKTVFERGYPIMESLGIKGCVYVVAGGIGTGRLLWTDMIDLLCLAGVDTGAVSLEFPDGIHSYPLCNRQVAFCSAKAIKARFRSLSERLRRRYFVQVEEAFARVPEEQIPDDYYFADWEQLRSVDPDVMEIGNHTLSHPNLGNVDEGILLREEIAGARTKIEAAIGRQVEHFCYPAGSYNDQVLRAVSKLGHASGVTTRYGVNAPGENVFELKRMGLPATLAHFKARVSGFERAVLRLRQVLGW